LFLFNLLFYTVIINSFFPNLQITILREIHHSMICSDVKPILSWKKSYYDFNTTRKTIIGRNVLCGAPKSARSTKIFWWRIEKYAPQKLWFYVAFLWRMWTGEPQNLYGPSWGLVLHMGEGNSVTHLPTRVTESQNSVVHVLYGFFTLHTTPPRGSLLLAL
jgi:hypothetical protein